MNVDIVWSYGVNRQLETPHSVLDDVEKVNASNTQVGFQST